MTLSFAAAGMLVGCRAETYQPTPQPVEANSFVQNWRADLNLKHDSVKALHVRENSVIAYTAENKGYWLAASGGSLMNINQIASRDHTLHPPVLLTDHLVIPTTGSVEVFDHAGNHVGSFQTPSAVQSPGSGIGNSLFLGVAHASAGRLARYDVDKTLSMNWEMYTTNGIVAAPATIGDSIYAAGIDGRVWAVNMNRVALWGLPENSFRTDGPITADLSADDFGVYVPSQDKKLYCLERTTGKIKWSYYAGMPLIDQPIVAGNIILQPVPNRGLAAVNKLDGPSAREAIWIAPGIRQVLAVDDKFVYGASDDNTIYALDRATGKPQFSTRRNDLRVFATNFQSPVIYAATKSGTIFSIRPVTKPGTVGEVVFQFTPLQAQVAQAD